MRDVVPPARAVFGAAAAVLRMGAAGPAPRAVVLAAGLLLPASAPAQTLRGRLLEEGSERPVPGAVISLVPPTGDAVAQTISADDGSFSIRPERRGEYYLQAARLGYETARTPLLLLDTAGVSNLDLMVRPAPVGLEGFEVTVRSIDQVRAELRFAGIDPEQLGNRFVSRAEIEAVGVKQDVGHVLQWQNIPGLGTYRTEDLAPGSDDIGLCVYLERSRQAGGGGRCALNVLNGVPVPGTTLRDVDPEAVQAIAVLRSYEAAQLYGTLGGGGAVLVWTRPIR